MVKLQQKCSGCYRTDTGATKYLTKGSYIATAHKQGISVLGALRDLFEGEPFLPSTAQA